MKKVSAAARKQGRNISRQTLTIGLDLGDRNSCYCVVDEATLLESANGSMATAATRQEKKLVEQKEENFNLPPTGILMEGVYTQNPRRVFRPRQGQ